MNAFTANDLEAPGLLARSGTVTARRRVHYWPAMAGCHAIWLAGAGQVSASRAEMTAAAPGRARRRLGMRHPSWAARPEPVIAVMAGRGWACRAE
jgi:hypothetical protein